jgi:hypothetical protein
VVQQPSDVHFAMVVSRLVLIGSPSTLLNNEAVMEAGEKMRELEDPISRRSS